MIAADMKVTQRSFNFGKKQGIPFYFVSAADGTNVVKVWTLFSCSINGINPQAFQIH